MNAAGRSATDSRASLGLRRAFVVVQVALSMVLVVGAVLFARTLRNMTAVDVGFRTDGIVMATIDLRRLTLPPDGRRQTFDDITDRIRAVPGVLGAAEVFITPLSGSVWNGKIMLSGVTQTPLVNFNQISGEYFRVMDIPLIQGRTFDAQDRPSSPIAVVVNEAFAQQFFPGRSPVGEVFHMEAQPGAAQPAHTVVGLVRNTKYADLREGVTPIAYLAWTQEREPSAAVQVVVRSDLPFPALRTALTRAVLSGAPGVTVSYEPMSRFVADLTSRERLMASLTMLFGVLAMTIASVGLYGLMSYAVSRRQAEFGIRLALGAAPSAIVQMVLSDSGRLVIVGIGVGIALSLAVSRYATTLLFGLTPWDAWSFAMAAVALATVSLLATWIPARKGARVSPSLALRE